VPLVLLVSYPCRRPVLVPRSMDAKKQEGWLDVVEVASC